MQRLILRLYGGLFCLFFAFIVTAQLLSFLGLYRALLVFPLTLAVFAGALWLYFRADNGWLAQMLPPEETSAPAQRLRIALFSGAIFLLVSVFLIRMGLFPCSTLGANLPSDATGYHFVKAIELVRTGTMWDLSVIYGEYPVGYESLISAGIFITGDVALTGVIHACGLVLLVLTLCLLLHRYTRLPLEVTLFLAVSLLFYPDVYSTALLIGKNDLLLSTLILAAILHSPIAPRGLPEGVHPFGLAFATCMAMCVKPGGYLILGFLWLVTLVQWARAYRQEKASTYLTLPVFVAAIVVMIPCGLWVIRNFAVMGRLVSPEVASFFSGSIFSSLSDPNLYNAGAESITLIALSLWIWLVATLIYGTRRFYLPAALLLIVMYLAFITTPLSAFHTVERRAVHIEWRYTLHTFFYVAVLLITLAEPLLMRLYRLALRWQIWIAVGMVAGCAAVMIGINPADILACRPENAMYLNDPYPEPVGTAGYRSAYDYVRREVHNSTIVGVGAIPYYLYVSPYSNKIFDVQPHPLGLPDLLPRPVPEYLIYFHPPWESSDVYPSDERLMLPYQWEVIYEDTKGIVYRRVPS